MPYIANPVSMGVLLVLATVTIVLALMTGSTTWVIAGRGASSATRAMVIPADEAPGPIHVPITASLATLGRGS